MTLWHLLAELAFDHRVTIGHRCEAHIKSERCEQIATLTLFWPGQTSKQCEHHAAWVREVAMALGFELRTEPLDVRRVEVAVDEAAARFAAMELT